jgi:hypothetical protein
MRHKQSIVYAAAFALAAAGAFAAQARRPAASSTVSEVLVTARGPNAVVDEVVVRPTSGQNMVGTTSANTSVN